MPKVRLLAPWTNDKGEPQAAGAVVDMEEHQAQDLSNRGMASYIEDEEAAAKAATEGGNYSSRATREGSGQPPEAQRSRTGQDAQNPTQPNDDAPRKK